MKPVRELGPQDEPALVRFFQENNRPEVTSLFRAFAFDAASAERICREPRRDRYFAMFEGHEIACFGMLRGWDEGFDVPTFGLVADHRFNGRGHGWRMWNWVMELGRELGCARMRITTDQSNTLILRMALKLGFLQTRELPNSRVELMAELTLPRYRQQKSGNDHRS
jgi:ribosomal-protein-alanine N-acetyltransferase